MGYYTRVLLTDWDDRPLSDLVAHSRAYGHPLRADAPLDDPGWREADLYGPEATSPIEVEANVGDDLVREELAELREEVEEAEAGPDALRRVLDHLDRTSAIVTVRVLASDSELGLQAAWVVLDYFAQRDGVLFQADGEGFYDGEKLIVSLS